MPDDPIVDSISRNAMQHLESFKESLKRTAAESLEVVERAKRQLEALTEATELGASKTFLGAAAMCVGVTQYPLQTPSFETADGRPIEVRFDDGRSMPVRMHGDPAALAALKGQYKVILLLYKNDPKESS